MSRTMNEACEKVACDNELGREDWYYLLVSHGLS